MMTPSNGNISTLLTFWAGNSLVTDEFPTQRPVTQSFDVFFDLGLNQQLANNGDASDLRCHHAAHNDVIVMK